MTKTLVRDARPADLEEIRAAISVANEQFRGAVPEAFLRAYLASALDVERRLYEAVVLVAELDGVIVGSITFYLDANDEHMGPGFPAGTAGLRATAVHPVARGRGIGRDLVEACVARAIAADSRAIALHTAEFMTTAIALYERLGFVRAPGYDFPIAEFFPYEQDDDLLAIAFIRALS